MEEDKKDALSTVQTDEQIRRSDGRNGDGCSELIHAVRIAAGARAEIGRHRGCFRQSWTTGDELMKGIREKGKTVRTRSRLDHRQGRE
jgi:hypothetical protein